MAQALASFRSAPTVPSWPAGTTAAPPSPPRPDEVAPSIHDIAVAVARLEEQNENSHQDREQIKRRLDLLIEITNRIALVADQVVQLRETAHERNNAIQKAFGALDERMRSTEGRMTSVDRRVAEAVDDLKRVSDTVIRSTTEVTTRRSVNYWWLGTVSAAIIAFGGFLDAVIGKWISITLLSGP